MSSKQFTAEQFLSAIPKSGGIVSLIAERVGCAWGTARKFIDEHPTVKTAYQNECETVKDMAESKLISSMNEGDLESIKWYLARKAKDRGYAPGVEVTGKDGGAIQQETTLKGDVYERIMARISDRMAGDEAGRSGSTAQVYEREGSE